MTIENALDSARESFWQTIRLKLQQFHSFVPKGANPALAGDFIEELVRGFIRDWIQPCLLLRGTLHPFDVNADYTEPCIPQIDGIVFDPRQGPSTIREGSFIVAHPRFCPGVIEIKKSTSKLLEMEERLRGIHKQYYRRDGIVLKPMTSVIGVIVHDPDPERHSRPEWAAPDPSLYESTSWHNCPIFILLKEVVPGQEYEPHTPAIEALINTIFSHGWAFDPRLPEIRQEIRTGIARLTTHFH